MLKKQSGFTLIELIVVIVVLGILAATALPKFGGIQSGARIGILNGAKGSVSAAMNIAYATQQAQGLASNVVVTLDGSTISMTHGYPGATYGIPGIFSAAGLDVTAYSANDAGTLGTSGGLFIIVRNAPTPANCGFSYTSPAAAESPAIGANVTTGC